MREHMEEWETEDIKKREYTEMQEWEKREMEEWEERVQKEIDECAEEENMEWYEKLGYQGAVVDLVSDYLLYYEMFELIGYLINDDGIEFDGVPILTDKQKLDVYVKKFYDYNVEARYMSDTIDLLNKTDPSQLDEMRYLIELFENRCQTLTAEMDELIVELEKDLEAEEERRNS